MVLVLVLVLVVVLVDVVVVGCGGFPGRAPAGVLLIRRPGATASATVRNRAKRASPRRRGWSPLRAVTWSHSASTCPHVSSTTRARKLEPSHEDQLDAWLAQDGWIGQVPSAASVAVSAFTPGGKFSCTALELLKPGRIWPADMNGLVLSQYVRPPGQKILVKFDGLSSGRKHAGQPRASDGDLPGRCRVRSARSRYSLRCRSRSPPACAGTVHQSCRAGTASCPGQARSERCAVAPTTRDRPAPDHAHAFGRESHGTVASAILHRLAAGPERSVSQRQPHGTEGTPQ